MSVVLLRVDERLIHGQVVVGWGGHLHPDRIVVVDDDLARSPWEQELYILGLQEGLEAVFVDVSEAREAMSSWQEDERRTIVLLRDVSTLARFAEGGGLRGESVNLGGVHHAEGRRLVLPYLFLSEEERAELDRVAGEGVDISARDIPGAARVSLRDLRR